MRSLLSILFIALSFTAFCQDISNLSDSLDLEAVIISASRAEQKDPVTFQNISIAEIENLYEGQDPAVLLQQLSPSIVSYSDAGTDIGNYAQFRLRGISQSRINVTLNGVPLNDMVDQGVFFSNFSDFGNSVESIQVQRGVSAAQNGVASYGGAINFESTNIFKGDAKTNLALTTGSFSTLRTSAEMKTGLLKNNTAAYGRFTRTTVDGYKTHSASDSYSIFGSFGWTGGKDVLKFTGFMGKTQNDQSYLPVLLSDIEANPRTNYNHPNDTDDFEQELFQLQYSRQLSDRANFNATAYYGGARGVFPFAIDNTTQFVFGLTNDHYGLITDFSYRADQLELKGGIQGYQFDRTNFEYVAPAVSAPYSLDDTDKFEISSFAKANYSWDKFSLYGNIQLRNIQLDLVGDPILGAGDFANDWTFFNYVIGAHYQLNRQSGLYLSYGRTSREPTRSDIFNGVMTPESVSDLEIGWRFSSSKLSIDANLFHMSFTDEITAVGALQELSYMEIRQNVPKSRRSGFELLFNYKANSKVSLGLNAAYLDSNVDQFDNGSEIFNDVQHIFAPKWTISPQVAWRASEKWSFLFSGRHVSSSFMELANIPSFELPSHTVANLNMEYRITSRAKIDLSINNIFDQLYFTDGAPVDFDFDGLVEGPGYRVQPPRHFYVTFALDL